MSDELVKELTVAIARADDFGAKILTAAIALIRAEVLEEAAKVCEPQPTEAWSYHWREAGQHIAAAIRALKDTPA